MEESHKEIKNKYLNTHIHTKYIYLIIFSQRPNKINLLKIINTKNKNYAHSSIYIQIHNYNFLAKYESSY